MNNQHVLLFDLDGTLLDSNRIWDDADLKFLANHGFTYNKEYHAGVAHTTLRKSAEFTKRFFNMQESVEEIIAEWMSIIQDSYRSAKLKPGVKDYLDHCRKSGRRMAIFTSCVPEHCQAALQANSIANYFDQIIYTEDLGIDKKSPETFRITADLLGVEPNEITFFDDSLANCKAAKTAGMTVVKIQDDRKLESNTDILGTCDIYIENFTQLPRTTDPFNAGL